MNNLFDYETAFSRNIGWLTDAELQQLRQKRIAIAGMGGVGGAHLLALTRLGFGAFTLADFDHFEVANFNRQFGASMSQVGRPKVEVMSEMALDINPQLDIRTFASGIDETNVRAFLNDADLYIDGLDFFVMESREAVFAECRAQAIPALTAAPLGWGVAMLAFAADGMSFEDYFQMSGQPWEEKLRRFLVGLSPTGMQFHALVDPTRLDIANRHGPSTPAGVYLCGALAATNAVKLLLSRGSVPLAPQSLHFDAFSNESLLIDRPGGIGHPELQTRLAAMRQQ